MHGCIAIAERSRNAIARKHQGVPDFAIGLRERWRSVARMEILTSFTRHPATVGESYWQHLFMATGFGLRMVAGGLACIVHALLPFLFEHTGSRCIANLHTRMVTKRSVAPTQANAIRG